MPAVKLNGAYDLHIHTNPSLFTRSGNDLDLARHAVESGLAGVMIKNHFESTVGRAFLATQAVEQANVFGGLVLNSFAGGLNPVAVETAIGLGAKQIWMPTLDAKAHVNVFGHAGGMGYQESGSEIQRAGITVLNEKLELKNEAKTILELCHKANIILGTAHLNAQEILCLAKFSAELGFKKLLITHPYFNPPMLTIAQQKELTQLGATLELCGGNLYPIPGTARLENYLETLEAVGSKSCILTSDAGQLRKSSPYEVLRIFAQCLMEKGISQKQINQMTIENPAQLLKG